MADDDELDREAILARRKRFIATALAGLALSQAACGDSVACLSFVPPQDADVIEDVVDATAEAGADVTDAGGDARDATAPDADAMPMPCLSPLPPDAGPDAGPDASPDAAPDAMPMPCLSPPPPDVPPARDASPMPCLSPPPPDGG
jgi:hypothetical protein